MKLIIGNYYYIENREFGFVNGVVKLISDYERIKDYFLVEPVKLNCASNFLRYALEPTSNLVILYKEEFTKNLGDNKEIIETLYGESNETCKR